MASPVHGRFCAAFATAESPRLSTGTARELLPWTLDSTSCPLNVKAVEATVIIQRITLRAQDLP